LAVRCRTLASGDGGSTVRVTAGEIAVGLPAGISGSGVALVLVGGEDRAGLQLTMLTIINPLNKSRIHLCFIACAIPFFPNLISLTLLHGFVVRN
jgi:hypothetical protein